MRARQEVWLPLASTRGEDECEDDIPNECHAVVVGACLLRDRVRVADFGLGLVFMVKVSFRVRVGVRDRDGDRVRDKDGDREGLGLAVAVRSLELRRHENLAHLTLALTLWPHP